MIDGVVDVRKLDELFARYGETLTAEEVADLLKAKKQTVWALLKEQDKDGNPAPDRMPADKIGKNWMIVRDELKERLLRRRNTPIE